jgi:predicted dehydrogenase
MPKIGLISFAHMHAWSYARHLRDHGDVEVTAVADDDEARGASACEKLRVPELFVEYLDLLNEPIDAVVICSENAHHAQHAIHAAEAGKHVLCEKPLATTSDDAARMVGAARTHGVRLMTAFPCRYHPAARRTRAAIADGKIGRVLAVNGTNHGKNPGGWFVRPELSGGGAITDHTVHLVDLLRWMTGEEVREVFAESTRFDRSLAVEDGGILSLRFDGFLATIDCSWSRPPSNPAWGDVTMEIIGTDGVLSLDLFAQEHLIVKEREKKVVAENWGDDMDRGLVRAFVDAVRAGREPEVTGIDGLRAVEVVETAYRSVASGRSEPVRHRAV